MTARYRAMQVSAPGVLELVERPIPLPGRGEVLIRVEACGICGADASDIEAFDTSIQPPRVPGHEVVGRIAAIGLDVPPIWSIGQRVGVGRLGGHCSFCDQCRDGAFNLCRNQPFVGASCDGGYAEIMMARASGLVSIPEDLAPQEAAPILCAGLATFNALKKCGAEPGDVVAIFGIGGLGHMALQYARNMGYRVVALGRGQDIAREAGMLGAHHYVDTQSEDAADSLKRLGGAAAIIATAASPAVISALTAGLAPRGTLIVLGAGKDPLTLSTGLLVGGERTVRGSITGTSKDNEKTLRFSLLAQVRPWIETMPLERANEAYQRMRSGDVKFRMVLTMPTSKEVCID